MFKLLVTLYTKTVVGSDNVYVKWLQRYSSYDRARYHLVPTNSHTPEHERETERERTYTYMHTHVNTRRFVMCVFKLLVTPYITRKWLALFTLQQHNWSQLVYALYMYRDNDYGTGWNINQHLQMARFAFSVSSSKRNVSWQSKSAQIIVLTNYHMHTHKHNCFSQATHLHLTVRNL